MRIGAVLVVTSWSLVDRQCIVRALLLHVQGRTISLNRWFYYILLHPFPSCRLLPTVFLYTLLLLLPISPHLSVPSQLQSWSPFQMSEEIISALQKTFNHANVGRIFLLNSYLSAYECARRHTPQDCSCSGHSAACLRTLSLCNWNCVDGDSLVRPASHVFFWAMMVWELAEVWNPSLKNMNQESCPFIGQVWYQIFQVRK
jgi:hypothetical protein